MKCPLCWAEKAYLRPVRGWTKWFLRCLALRPMKCQHCYHKFVVFWPLTIGKRVVPPALKIYQPPAMGRESTVASDSQPQMKVPRRTKAA